MLAISLWAVAAYTLATPGRLDRNGTLKGIDFCASWLSGRLVSEGRPDLLYDRAEWRERLRVLFPEAPGLLFFPNYPPQAALIFSPFGRLPFAQGLVLWTAVSLALYAWSIHALWKLSAALAQEGITVALAAVGWPAFFLLALNAQTTAIVLACSTLAAIAHAARRDWWMGFAFGLTAVKPHFGLVPAAVLLLSGRWTAIAGMGAAVALQAAAVWATLGPGVFGAFWRTSLEVLRDPAPFEPKLWQAHGVRNALDLLLGQGMTSTVLYLVAAAVVLAILTRAWRDHAAPRRWQFAVLVTGSTLLTPHLYGYDLVVLAPALFFAAASAVEHPERPLSRRLAWLTIAVMLAPLAAPLGAVTRLQMSVPLLAWFGWTLLTMRDTEPAAGPAAAGAGPSGESTAWP